VGGESCSARALAELDTNKWQVLQDAVHFVKAILTAKVLFWNIPINSWSKSSLAQNVWHSGHWLFSFKLSSTTDIIMRVPLMHAFPWQTAGSTTI
jgi:hypothetical protein